jgi:hypothetical protein
MMWGLFCEAYRQECLKTIGGSLLNHAKRLPVNAYFQILLWFNQNGINSTFR